MKKIFFLGFISLFLTFKAFCSDNITIPHQFSSGEIISSSKINENFNLIESKINSQTFVNAEANWIKIGNLQIVSGQEYNTSQITIAYPFAKPAHLTGVCTGGNEINTILALLYLNCS